jgi:hypothetical protein
MTARLRRSTRRPETPALTVDRVLSHWLTKLLGTALLALAGYVYNGQLDGISRSIEGTTSAVTEVTSAVTQLKEDVSEFKAEQRSFQNVTTAQYTALETRVAGLERAVELEKEADAKKMTEWQKTYQQWLEEDAAWKKRRGR